MKAFILERYSKESLLRETTLPDPVPGDTDVLIDIAAAGLNPLDLRIRDGAFRLLMPYRLPFVLGHDLAGTVVAVVRPCARSRSVMRSIPGLETDASGRSRSGSRFTRTTWLSNPGTSR